MGTMKHLTKPAVVFYPLQMDAISASYKELELEYRKSRDDGKKSLTDFKNEAEAKFAELETKQQSLETNLRKYHVVRQ